MANFNGSQSLNGIQTQTIFTAPAAGIYFIQGYLNLPQLPTAGAASAVIAYVKVNGSTSYTGLAGASGFAVNQLTLASGDVVAVQLDSAAACDLVRNAVSGQVYYGNTF